MLDDMIDFMAGVRSRPVWQQMPDEARARLKGPLPLEPNSLASVYEEFQQLVQPYIAGNIHPRFLGWVQGGGTPVGMLAEMLAATLNGNLGGRDQAPIEVERQVIRWATQMMGFPEDSGGLLVTGASMANMIGVLVARTGMLGAEVRREGLGGRRLLAYTSPAAHNCIARAIDMAGLGTDALRLIPTDERHGMDLALLAETIERDRADGGVPFMVIGTAGTVDTGAIDDLAGIAALCRAQKLWFHVDAALGATAMLSQRQRHKLHGISEADSVAFDFHKWAQVPYDVGCVLVRDAELHRATFASNPNYLARETRGLAAGHPWPTDFGPDLSRGFRALKVWMSLKTYGADHLGRVVDHCCALAQQLAARVVGEAELELLSPVSLNIVCFRFLAREHMDRLNTDIVVALQESGVAVPSTTRVNGHIAIRCAFVNHRTSEQDIDIVLRAVLETGRRLAGASALARDPMERAA
ncbi:cytochrome D ubiquinol oxidase subunit I [Massilia sp. PAMC28688]|nr:cytochrome D ubiquinol oxidase subunit I [Massilia sp. PAMC28688]